MKKIIAIGAVFVLIIGGGYMLFNGEKKSDEEKSTITVSAAASLYEPLNKIKEIYEKEHKDVKLDINFASSSTLEKQIEQGASVDLFISASPKYTKALVDKNIIKKDDVKDFLGNKLILAKNSNVTEKISSIEGLKNTTGKIAIGDKAVPVGFYAEEALNNLGILSSISSRIVYCKDAVSVLNYLEKGEVNYGVIYENELIGAKNITKVADFPKNTHEPITYTMANLNGSKNTIGFKDFLNSNEAKEILKNYGFEVY